MEYLNTVEYSKYIKSLMEYYQDNKEEEVFVIGGGQIYQQAIDLVDKIDLTRVHTSVEADAFFPEINTQKWELVFEEFHSKDENHKYDFTFLTYIKK